jgi:pyridinium-3,5-biscarboxylic acid mononucleotide sulfurtransferase
MRQLGSCAVALSGGVDSVVVAKAAQLGLGSNAVAVTGLSPSLAEGELDAAKLAADLIGIRHRVLETEEYLQAQYIRNAPDRCYHCKTELYLRIDAIKDELQVGHVANGANADDLGDYRPGMKAAKERDVISPLIENDLGKGDVRALALSWELPMWDKPASPCLASRVAYGEEVTPERLAMIDQAEQFLRQQGIKETRVRLHGDNLARLEVPLAELPRLASVPIRDQIVTRFLELGFRYVTLDLQGFRSGSLNLVPLGG